MSPAQIGFLAAGAAALAYGLTLDRRSPSLAKGLARALPCAALSIAARIADAPTFLGLALALSALSDAALASDPTRRRPAGLAALIAAHVAYGVLVVELGDLRLLVGLAVLLVSDGLRRRGGAGAWWVYVAAHGMIAWPLMRPW